VSVRECRVGFVGAGATTREHMRAFRDVPGVTLAGLVSRTLQRAHELGGELGVPVFESIEMLALMAPDLVVIAVPVAVTADVVRACLAHKRWTILVEKPPAIDLAHALALKAEAAGRRVFVALNRRCIAVTVEVRDALAAAPPGPRFVHVQDQQNLERARAAGHPPEVVAAWMYANSIHLVDYFAVLARGPVAHVEPVVPWRADRPGPVVARIDFASGDVGLYHALWDAPGPWAVTVTVPSRRWELRPLEQGTTQALGEPQRILPAHAWDSAYKPGFRLQAERAVRAAAGEDAGLATLDDAIETMQLVAKLYD
jgi:predicted dehydrogenase